MDAHPKPTGKPSGRERRQSPRAKIEQPVRIRTDVVESVVELRKTRDVSRTGFFFITHSDQYYVGLRLYVVMGYRPSDPISKEWLAEVVRIEKLPAGLFGVAVRILLR